MSVPIGPLADRQCSQTEDLLGHVLPADLHGGQPQGQFRLVHPGGVPRPPKGPLGRFARKKRRSKDDELAAATLGLGQQALAGHVVHQHWQLEEEIEEASGSEVGRELGPVLAGSALTTRGAMIEGLHPPALPHALHHGRDGRSVERVLPLKVHVFCEGPKKSQNLHWCLVHVI